MVYFVFRYTGAFKRCFNWKIEPVFSVGTGDPERSSYGPNMAHRVLKSRLFYRNCIAQSFPFQFWACQGPANPHVTRLAHAPSLFVYSHRTRTLLPLSSLYWDSVDSQI